MVIDYRCNYVSDDNHGHHWESGTLIVEELCHYFCFFSVLQMVSHHIATGEKLSITDMGCPQVLHCKNAQVAYFVLDLCFEGLLHCQKSKSICFSERHTGLIMDCKVRKFEFRFFHLPVDLWQVIWYLDSVYSFVKVGKYIFFKEVFLRLKYINAFYCVLSKLLIDISFSCLLLSVCTVTTPTISSSPED